MKSVVLAVALTGLISVTALAGNIPTSDAQTPGNIPTNDVVSPAQGATSSSVVVANVVLTIIKLINR
jgi:hypothetical protein